MANENNLGPPREGFTHEEASKGGKKSAEKRRLQSAVKKALGKKLPKRDFDGIRDMLLDMGLEKKDPNFSDAIAYAMVHEAVNGNVKAATWVRDTAGEKPTEKVEADLGQRTVDRLAGLSLSQKGQMLDAMLEEARGNNDDSQSESDMTPHPSADAPTFPSKGKA